MLIISEIHYPVLIVQTLGKIKFSVTVDELTDYEIKTKESVIIQTETEIKESRTETKTKDTTCQQTLF